MIEVRCVSCGHLFKIEETERSGNCPFCGCARKLTWVRCSRCAAEFGVFNRCKAHCPSCGHIHDCDEIEVVKE